MPANHAILATITLSLPALAIAVPARADYNGITVEKHTTVGIGAGNYDVWRVYANFTDPGDRLVIVFGSPAIGAMTLQTRNGNDSGFGDPFYNHALAGTTAPGQAAVDANPDVRWDTFVTLGASISDMATPNFLTLSPGFVGITGTNWVQGNQAWYVPPTADTDGNSGTPTVPPPQSMAGWQGDGDLQQRVLMMQLTVHAGDNIRGTLNLSWFHPVLFGQNEVNESFQTFNTFSVPSPGAIALLGLAGLTMMNGRRRR